MLVSAASYGCARLRNHLILWALQSRPRALPGPALPGPAGAGLGQGVPLLHSPAVLCSLPSRAARTHTRLPPHARRLRQLGLPLSTSWFDLKSQVSLASFCLLFTSPPVTEVYVNLGFLASAFLSYTARIYFHDFKILCFLLLGSGYYCVVRYNIAQLVGFYIFLQEILI